MQNSGNQKKWVMITGANRGIGRATLECFSREGWCVLAHSRKCYQEFNDDCMEIADNCGTEIRHVYFELSDPDEIRKSMKDVMASDFQLDALVNCAGIAKFKFFPMMSMKEVRNVFDINLFSSMQISQMLLNKWIRRKSGCIVNVCSVAGFDLNTNNAAYGVSKAGLIAFTKELAMEMGQFGIRVNGVAPGIVDTDMVSESGEENYREMVRASAMKRAASPDEVASVIHWLCCGEAAYVNGQIIRVDGGMM